MQSLTHVHVRKMLIGAYLCILTEKEEINRVNLFPVPDKDTGSNLVRTLRGVYDVVSMRDFDNIATLRHEALEGALTTAAGNAGIIMTSFLEGFLTSCTDTISSATLVTAFRVGSDRAYASVQQPKSGTILDVMRDTAFGLQNSTLSNDPTVTLASAHSIAKNSLAKTKTFSAKSLGRKVVDAGGLGFVMFLQGFLQGLEQDDTLPRVVPTREVSAKSIVTLQEKQHEVVSLLGDVRASRSTIVDTLAKHGDSIDIIELHGKMKIHIHTDDPAQVRQLLAGFGNLLDSKTVNMNEGELPVATDRRRTIGIVVDEGASLSPTYAKKHGICVVPFQFQWDMHPNIRSDSLYSTMRSVDRKNTSFPLPHTSQPSPHTFLQSFRRELQDHDSVLCILTSSRVSGTFNSAQHARNLLSPLERERVIIPDFRQALAGQSLLVRLALDSMKSSLPVESLVAELIKQANSIDVFGFGTDTFWLVKGGRMSIVRSKIVNMLFHLGIQPVIGLRNGKLSAIGLVRRRKSLADMAYHYLTSTYGSAGHAQYQVVLHDSDIPDEVTRLKELLQDSQFEVVESGTLSPIAGIHIGPGALIVGISNANQ